MVPKPPQWVRSHGSTGAELGRNKGGNALPPPSGGSKGALGGATAPPIAKSSAPNSAPNKKSQSVFFNDNKKSKLKIGLVPGPMLFGKSFED